MFKKNDILTVTITDQGISGEGIGKVDGYALFVKDAARGDVAKVKIMKAKKNYAFAKLMEIITPSPNRVTPKCPVATSCGGCQLQAINYEEQLRFKEEKVYNNLKRIGKVENFTPEPIIGMEEPFHYRNKEQFPVSRDSDGKIVTGFYAGRTHHIVEVSDCKLGITIDGKDICRDVVDIIKKFMEEKNIAPYDEKNHSGLVRHILVRMAERTRQVMVCIIINGEEVPFQDELVTRFSVIPEIKSISLSVNKTKGNVIMGDKIINLYGDGFIEDYIKDVKFRISPLPFFQVNARQTEKLYDKALEYAGLTGNEVVWDLYCGIGTISLFLARSAKSVLGVEIVPQAIEDAKTNAKENNIENAEFFAGAVEDVIPEKVEKGEIDENPDVVVVDPPRKGCDEGLLNMIVDVAPEKIVYVSCDSATLARDVRYLEERGYKLKKACPVDMFPQTCHVETVVLMSRVSNEPCTERA